MTSSEMFALVVAGAVGTFVLRASFLTLVPSERLPGWAKRGLRYVPPAVLAALAVPAFLPTELPPDNAASLARPLAAVVAAIVAWRAGNIFLTIGAGMASLWLLNLVL